MLEFLKRPRSPRVLIGTLVLAWVVMITTSQVGSPDQGLLMTVALVVVVGIGLLVVAFCLVKLALHALRR
ncbi:hypothetical protein ACOCJ7_01365 [Knoellia sp. CPCC 206453]|uniref:hypothetical protein n=1 Tax=Knoellia pratensis TaxID=3404796 RepID=UPI00361B2E25